MKHTALLLLITPLFITPSHADNLQDVLAKGKVSLNLRYRTEFVDQHNMPQQAIANTLRGRFSYQSGAYHGFSGTLEVDGLWSLGTDKYNSTLNGVSDRPVIADPTGQDLNQAYLSYQQQHLSLDAGRQRINLDDQRFVGGVGWRQNEQTFDALRVKFTPQENLNLDYSYISKVNRIFGEDSPQGRFSGDTHLVNGRFALDAQQSISAFAYWMDFEQAPQLSNKTFGLRYQGSLPAMRLTLSLARQQDYAEQPVDYDATYGLAQIDGELSGISWTLGYEKLGADSQGRVITPLATLHKFQGFADQFLNTPLSGLQDRYAGAGTTLAGIKLQLTYHRFDSDKQAIRYGHEWDASAAYAVNAHLKLLLKMARYRAKHHGSDTDKLWLMVTANW